ncbi:hypothetical protein [Gordonia lacunae]|nr:hypothetical protein [Gordonia lacunae]
MTSDSSPTGVNDPDDQHDPDADPEMLTTNASQPDQAEGADDAEETGDDSGD